MQLAKMDDKIHDSQGIWSNRVGEVRVPKLTIPTSLIFAIYNQIISPLMPIHSDHITLVLSALI